MKINPHLGILQPLRGGPVFRERIPVRLIRHFAHGQSVRQQKRREKQAKRLARRELKKEEAEATADVPQPEDPMDDPTIDWGAVQAVDPADLFDHR